MAYTPAPIEPTLSLRPEPRGDDHTFFGHPRGLGWLSYAEFWSLLLLVGGANFLIAAPAPHGPSSQAQCVALGLSTCPQPFDAILPDPAYMLSWDQQTRVIGFRNTYRQYPGDVIHTHGSNAYPLPEASKAMPPLR